MPNDKPDDSLLPAYKPPNPNHATRDLAEQRLAETIEDDEALYEYDLRSSTVVTLWRIVNSLATSNDLKKAKQAHKEEKMLEEKVMAEFPLLTTMSKEHSQLHNEFVEQAKQSYKKWSTTTIGKWAQQQIAALKQAIKDYEFDSKQLNNLRDDIIAFIDTHTEQAYNDEIDPVHIAVDSDKKNKITVNYTPWQVFALLQYFAEKYDEYTKKDLRQSLYIALARLTQEYKNNLGRCREGLRSVLITSVCFGYPGIYLTNDIQLEIYNCAEHYFRRTLDQQETKKAAAYRKKYVWLCQWAMLNSGVSYPEWYTKEIYGKIINFFKTDNKLLNHVIQHLSQFYIFYDRNNLTLRLANFHEKKPRLNFSNDIEKKINALFLNIIPADQQTAINEVRRLICEMSDNITLKHSLLLEFVHILKARELIQELALYNHTTDSTSPIANHLEILAASYANNTIAQRQKMLNAAEEITKFHQQVLATDPHSQFFTDFFKNWQLIYKNNLHFGNCFLKQRDLLNKLTKHYKPLGEFFFENYANGNVDNLNKSENRAHHVVQAQSGGIKLRLDQLHRIILHAFFVDPANWSNAFVTSLQRIKPLLEQDRNNPDSIYSSLLQQLRLLVKFRNNEPINEFDWKYRFPFPILWESISHQILKNFRNFLLLTSIASSAPVYNYWLCYLGHLPGQHIAQLYVLNKTLDDKSKNKNSSRLNKFLLGYDDDPDSAIYNFWSLVCRYNPTPAIYLLTSPAVRLFPDNIADYLKKPIDNPSCAHNDNLLQLLFGLTLVEGSCNLLEPQAPSKPLLEAFWGRLSASLGYYLIRFLSNDLLSRFKKSNETVYTQFCEKSITALKQQLNIKKSCALTNDEYKADDNDYHDTSWVNLWLAARLARHSLGANSAVTKELEEQLFKKLKLANDPQRLFCLVAESTDHCDRLGNNAQVRSHMITLACQQDPATAYYMLSEPDLQNLYLLDSDISDLAKLISSDPKHFVEQYFNNDTFFQNIINTFGSRKAQTNVLLHAGYLLFEKLAADDITSLIKDKILHLINLSDITKLASSTAIAKPFVKQINSLLTHWDSLQAKLPVNNYFSELSKHLHLWDFNQLSTDSILMLLDPVWIDNQKQYDEIWGRLLPMNKSANEMITQLNNIWTQCLSKNNSKAVIDNLINLFERCFVTSSTDVSKVWGNVILLLPNQLKPESLLTLLNKINEKLQSSNRSLHDFLSQTNLDSGASQLNMTVTKNIFRSDIDSDLLLKNLMRIDEQFEQVYKKYFIQTYITDYLNEVNSNSIQISPFSRLHSWPSLIQSWVTELIESLKRNGNDVNQWHANKQQLTKMLAAIVHDSEAQVPGEILTNLYNALLSYFDSDAKMISSYLAKEYPQILSNIFINRPYFLHNKAQEWLENNEQNVILWLFSLKNQSEEELKEFYADIPIAFAKQLIAILFRVACQQDFNEGLQWVLEAYAFLTSDYLRGDNALEQDDVEICLIELYKTLTNPADRNRYMRLAANLLITIAPSSRLWNVDDDDVLLLTSSEANAKPKPLLTEMQERLKDQQCWLFAWWTNERESCMHFLGAISQLQNYTTDDEQQELRGAAQAISIVIREAFADPVVVKNLAINLIARAGLIQTDEERHSLLDVLPYLSRELILALSVQRDLSNNLIHNYLAKYEDKLSVLRKSNLHYLQVFAISCKSLTADINTRYQNHIAKKINLCATNFLNTEQDVIKKLFADMSNEKNQDSAILNAHDNKGNNILHIWATQAPSADNLKLWLTKISDNLKNLMIILPTLMQKNQEGLTHFDIMYKRFGKHLHRPFLQFIFKLIKANNLNTKKLLAMPLLTDIMLKTIISTPKLLKAQNKIHLQQKESPIFKNLKLKYETFTLSKLAAYLIKHRFNATSAVRTLLYRYYSNDITMLIACQPKKLLTSSKCGQFNSRKPGKFKETLYNYLSDQKDFSKFTINDFVTESSLASFRNSSAGKIVCETITALTQNADQALSMLEEKSEIPTSSSP